MNCSWNLRDTAGRVCGRYSLMMDGSGRKRRAFGVVFPATPEERVVMCDSLPELRALLNERGQDVTLDKTTAR